MPKNNWSRDEHIVAFNLYCKIPFSKINAAYASIKELPGIMGRSNGSVAMKLANFAHLDPALQTRNVSSLSRGAKGEEEDWKAFHGNWEELAWQSEQILANFKGKSVEEFAEVELLDLSREGLDRESLVKIRVNQNFFRKTILASYNNSCCIRGINQPELLVAWHIKPWNLDKENRLNHRNGLAMNNLHDKAFENGLFTITPDYKILVSDELKRNKDGAILDYFLKFENKKIMLPSKFLPHAEFLNYHNDERFRK